MSKILVLGANGNVGRPLVEYLIAKGEAVKAATRSGTAIAGAETLRFDINKPDFDAAFADVNRLYLMLPAGNLAITELLLPLVSEAAIRGIKIVFQSVLGVDADDSIPYRQVEIAIEQAGVPYVILRPNWFSDNFHSYWKAGIDQGVIAVPAGDGKSSFVDARDIAASAAAALTTDEFDGKAFNLTGPEALSYAEAASVLSDALGRSVQYKAVDDVTFVDATVAAGVPRDYAEFLASIFHPVREGWTAQVSSDVQTLTGKTPISVAQYAKDHIDDLRG